MVKPFSLFLALTSVMALLTISCTQTDPPSASASAATPKAHIAWDWTGIIGTGQSLAVGQNASQIASTTQPYHNLKLSTDSLPWPIDPNADQLQLVPLVEPDGRRSTSYPSAWPTNLAGETPHAAMANEMTALVEAQFGRDFVSIHAEVGENGQGMQYIRKNPARDPRNINGHAYEGSLVETKAIARLARAAGKTFGVGAITIVHGETDSGNAQYEQQMRQLWQDYSTDLPAITGQTQKILMIVSQQCGIGNPSASTVAQWKVGVDYPDDIVCAGPKYQFQSGDGLHLTTDGYRQLGEKFGEIYFHRVILGNPWQPLQPTAIVHDGNTLTVKFHVPLGPLVWDAQMDPPHAGVAEWKNGKGFEVSTAANQRVTIASADIQGDAVVLTCVADPGAGARVSYAMTGERRRAQPAPGFQRWGLLRDSDPLKGVGTGKVQPNYAVAFEMTAP
jgi:hypothetical protein